MSIGVVLDVAIGLALTYMLLGLIASALQESVAVVLKWRGRQLRDGITNLLAGDGAVAGAAAALARDVHAHALVQGTSGSGLPSYVSARNFTLALFDVLSAGTQAAAFGQIERGVAALPDCRAKQSLAALIVRANGDLNALRSSVETWYDDAMDRLSGDYKRWSHYFALVFGLAVAVVFNVDSINLAHSLWEDPSLRAAYVAAAEHYTSQPPAAPKTEGLSAMQSEYQTAVSALRSLAPPIGWQVLNWHELIALVGARLADGSIVWMLLGWIATALAVSLGAPFWFDTLQKLFSVRGSGPKPAQAAAS